MQRKKKAFTLTELLVVVVIIGVLSAIVLPKFNKTLETRKTTEAEDIMRAVRTEQEYRCAADRPYTTNTGDLSAWTGSDTKNYAFTLGNEGMIAKRSGKNYSLRIPSYADGRICCEGDGCSSLNKDYVECSSLTGASDYVPAPTNCAVEGPDPIGAVEGCTEGATDGPVTCGPCNNGIKTTRKCVGGVWVAYESDCQIQEACVCQPVGSPAVEMGDCNGCGHRARQQYWDTDSCSWVWGNWGNCSVAPNSCECDPATRQSRQGTEACNTCGVRTECQTCDMSKGEWTWNEVEECGCSVASADECGDLEYCELMSIKDALGDHGIYDICDNAGLTFNAEQSENLMVREDADEAEIIRVCCGAHCPTGEVWSETYGICCPSGKKAMRNEAGVAMCVDSCDPAKLGSNWYEKNGECVEKFKPVLTENDFGIFSNSPNYVVGGVTIQGTCSTTKHGSERAINPCPNTAEVGNVADFCSGCDAKQDTCNQECYLTSKLSDAQRQAKEILYWRAGETLASNSYSAEGNTYHGNYIEVKFKAGSHPRTGNIQMNSQNVTGYEFVGVRTYPDQTLCRCQFNAWNNGIAHTANECPITLQDVKSHTNVCSECSGLSQWATFGGSCECSGTVSRPSVETHNGTFLVCIKPKMYGVKGYKCVAN